MNYIRTLVRSARVPFLLLTPSVLSLGWATAHASGRPWSLLDLVLILLAGVAAHVSVNALNEYCDFRSGLDGMTQRTPFSGGSGALPEAPSAAVGVLALGVIALLITSAIGGYFVLREGWGLALLGLCGVVVIVAYTPWFNRNPWLCLMSPGLAFGPLMVVGCHWALVGEFSVTALCLSLVPFFLCNNLLLLNQLPDLDADRRVGRRHIMIAYGVGAGLRIYRLFILAAAAVIVGAVLSRSVSVWSLCALLPLLPAAFGYRTLRVSGTGEASLAKALPANVITSLLTPLVLAITLSL